MKTVTKTAFANIKLNKSRNILIGIAICLTTLLLFLIPGIGLGMMNTQFEAVNQVYPTFHGMYRDVSYERTQEIKAVDKIETAGLRCDPGYMVNDEYHIPMVSVDEICMELNKAEVPQGHMPQKADEIVVSEGLLKAMGVGGIGDTIKVPYQLMKKDGLDYSKEKEFVICGMMKDSEVNEEKKMYTAYVSEAFVKEELAKADRFYRIYFRLKTGAQTNTDIIEKDMKKIALDFGLSEKDILENTDYLAANYVDPVMVPTLVIIMIIVVLAGMITIYSIYYVSMVHRVQEYGRLKAIGATKKQIRQIVFQEGFLTALLAIPVGLILGTVILQNIFRMIYSLFSMESNVLNDTLLKVIQNHEVSYLHWWIYVLAAVVSLLTIYLSLLKPMKIAARISPIEALRYNGEGGFGKSFRKGYDAITLFRLTKSNLWGNRKRTVITILSMAVTGIFFIAISTVLSCANPRESANASLEGKYELRVITEWGNKEHPELEWSQVQQNNPLTDKVVKEILDLEGVEKVERFSHIEMKNKVFDMNEETASLIGIPQSYAKTLEKGLVEGKITYEELKKGDKVILSKTALHWYPDFKIGDKFTFTYQDGNEEKEKTLEIAAIGDYSHGLAGYGEFLWAEEAMKTMTSNNIYNRAAVFADKNYDENLEKQLQSLCDTTGGIQISATWQSSYETWKQGMEFTSLGCNLFLGILGIICIMNLINTMINSILMRKKELGMMQAIGLSENQLIAMLNLEGLFYTMGTIFCSISAGTIAGYFMFLYAKAHGMFNITRYHYPVEASVILIVLMFVIQMLLGIVIGKSLKKQSLIERIRFSE